ncbi:8620_t:CDS:2, partial [Ambispora gerdemannii]
ACDWMDKAVKEYTLMGRIKRPAYSLIEIGSNKPGEYKKKIGIKEGGENLESVNETDLESEYSEPKRREIILIH